jgi:DNA-binding phage protein
LGEASLYIFYAVEFGKLTADFLIKFKAWIDRQNESEAEIARQLGISRQALTDQFALRKRPNAETLLRMQEMMKKRPRKKGTSAHQITELRQRYPRLLAI